MNNQDFHIFFDCGFSKTRAGVFNKKKVEEVLYFSSQFYTDHKNLGLEIQKIISNIEKDTNEYIDNINLMIDSHKMLSIGISISKKIEGPQLRQEDIQFLVQEAKQQILKHNHNQNIIHIIINNYKVNNINYNYLPINIECNLISLDIIFICLPEATIKYYKNIFYKLDISINQIICSSYAKAVNYKNSFSLFKEISFIDVGFNKTSIINYVNNKITSIDVLPLGGNHITSDISKILEIDLEQAENLKINFSKNINDDYYSEEMFKKIIFSRSEEILEMCARIIGLNLITADKYKIILMGEGSKIFKNQYEDKLFPINSVDFLEETTESICLSGFKLAMGLNKQEVVVIPKKQIKQGFFEKLFHLFN